MKAKYTTLSTEGQIIIRSRSASNGQTLILRPITPEFIDSLMCGLTKGLGELRDAMHRDDKERCPP